MKTTRLSPDPAIVPGSDAFARFLATAHSSQNLNPSTTMHTQLPSSPSHSRRSRSALFGLALLAAAFVATAGLPPEESKNAKPAPPPAQKPPADPVPQTLVDFHAAHIHEFETTPGLGFARMIRMPFSTPVTIAGLDYRASKPDLIALETMPIAYRSGGGEMIGLRNLTNRTARAGLPVRPITAEENDAIAELREGSHIVQKKITVTQSRVGSVRILDDEPSKGTGRSVTDTGTQTRPSASDAAAIAAIVGPRITHAEVPAVLVIGALRAKATCARCHECPEGTLLGAFSYTLRPASSLPGFALPTVSPRR